MEVRLRDKLGVEAHEPPAVDSVTLRVRVVVPSVIVIVPDPAPPLT